VIHRGREVVPRVDQGPIEIEDDVLEHELSDPEREARRGFAEPGAGSGGIGGAQRA